MTNVSTIVITFVTLLANFKKNYQKYVITKV